MNKEEQALIEELTKEEAQEDTSVNKNEPAPQKRAKLTGKQATTGLAVLVILLLLFFLGMRLLERRAKEKTAQPVTSIITETDAETDGKIDLNTATKDELKTLHGVGDKKAQAIIDHRNEYGPFTSIEELTEVDGIGEGIFEENKDLICVR